MEVDLRITSICLCLFPNAVLTIVHLVDDCIKRHLLHLSETYYMTHVFIPPFMCHYILVSLGWRVDERINPKEMR